MQSSNQNPVSAEPLSYEEMRALFSRLTDMMQTYFADEKRNRETIAKLDESEREGERSFRQKEQAKADELGSLKRKLERLPSEYRAFLSSYEERITKAYASGLEEARRQLRDELTRLRSEQDAKETEIYKLSSRLDELTNEYKRKSRRRKELSAESDRIAAWGDENRKKQDLQLEAYNREMARFRKKHGWYGKRIDVLTSGKGDKRQTRFELRQQLSGLERRLADGYGKLFARKDRERLMAEAMKLHKVFQECDRQHEAFEKVMRQLEELHAVQNRMLDDRTPIEKTLTKLLDETELLRRKTEKLEQESDFDRPLSPELIRQDRSGRLSLPLSRQRELLQEVPHARDYPLREQALKRQPFPDAYLEREDWKEWLDRQEAGQRELLETDLRQGEEELSSLRLRHGQALGALAERRERCAAQQDEKRKACREAFEKWKEAFDAIRDPALVPVWDRPDFSEDTARELCQQIADRAAGRTVMPALPVGYERIETIEGPVTLPRWVEWQRPNGEGAYNFLIEYAGEERLQAVETLNDLLMQMICAFPAKKLKFTFVDLNVTNQASLFTINLDARLYHNDPLVKEQDLRKRLEELQDRMVTVSKQCSDLLRYNEQNRTILFPYEVVVLLDYPRNLSPQLVQQMIPLCEHGHNGGIFFVILREKGGSPKSASGVSFPDPTASGSFRRLDLKPSGEAEGVNRYLPLASTPVLREACFAYLNAEAQKEERTRIIEQPMERLYEAPYADAAGEFKVAVGENNGRTAWFRFDEAGHAHAFVLGQSGSGKSVFLHNVIGNALLQYAPDSLQLYLLDFKLGGVEFNRYREARQVRALLVDNSDTQITLEILRELYETMRRRGELLRNAGVSSLRDYNAGHPEARLPRIVLAVDECHELFRDRMDKTQTEINAIVTRIAKEGRSQGVHLLLATQTLANANIPSELLNNVPDHYLLKCAQNDAEKLVRDSGKQTSALTTGWLLYAHEDKRELFQAYFAGRERMDENLRRILEKSASFPSEKGFFFSGKQRFPFDAGVLEAIALKSRRHPAVLLGRSVDLRQSPVGFPLKPGLGENALFFGINTQEQTLRVLFDAMVSLMVSFRHLALQGRFYVLNCLNLQEDSPAEALLHAMESYGCTVVEGADRGKLLATLAGEVRQRTARECVVAVLGQERFREVRLEMPLPSGEESTPAEGQAPTASHLGALGALRPRAEKRTYKSELRYLLENGAEQGVHFLLQVDKPGNLLFENVLTQQAVFSMFKHLVMLRSAPDAALKLRLSDDIKLENLSEEPERLRAYYYNDEEGAYTLFTPYLLPNRNDLEAFFK